MIATRYARRLAAVAAIACLAALLAGCLLSPGKFVASLDVRRAGAFTFKYDGEIGVLALSKLAAMGAAEEETFKPLPMCSDSGEPGDACSDEDEAAQRKAWDDGAPERRAKKEQEAATMRAMLGGIDPSNPQAAEELAARLRRQIGWNRVDYKGDGLFDVSFALTGRLDRDFVFPTVEGLPMANVFVAVSARQGGTVRIDAPAFAPQGASNPLQAMMMGGMMQGAAQAAAGGKSDQMDTAAGETGEPAKQAAMPPFPALDGTFTVTTDGEILANNTDEGPVSSPQGKTLTWPVNLRTRQAPTALIKLN